MKISAVVAVAAWLGQLGAKSVARSAISGQNSGVGDDKYNDNYRRIQLGTVGQEEGGMGKRRVNRPKLEYLEMMVESGPIHTASVMETMYLTCLLLVVTTRKVWCNKSSQRREKEGGEAY